LLVKDSSIKLIRAYSKEMDSIDMKTNKDKEKTQELLEKYFEKLYRIADELGDINLEICHDITKLKKEETK